ncbi:MAG: hypothetical protein K1X74_09160 [Pirellulales bacterium]|nr:hypothetical protein [Pirellulales bacterium]
MVTLALTGCGPGVYAGPFGYPFPVSPFYQDQQEDRFWVKERYDRVPVLGPITSGDTVVALDPPSPDEVMRAMPSIEGTVPLLYEKHRDKVRMTIEPIGDYVDPPRVYPLIGPAQLHHAHYKCTIYFVETTHVGWPVPYTTVDEDSVEVVYIDHEHFHIVGNVEDTATGNY